MPWKSTASRTRLCTRRRRSIMADNGKEIIRINKALVSARNVIGLMLCYMTSEQREKIYPAYQDFMDEVKALNEVNG